MRSETKDSRNAEIETSATHKATPSATTVPEVKTSTPSEAIEERTEKVEVS